MYASYLSYITIINPRRACAARVTVVVLCVCLSVTHYSRTTGYEAAYERYQQLQCYTAFERYNFNTIQCENNQYAYITSTGLPRPGLARSAHRGRIKLLRGYVSKSSAALNPLTITQLACELSMRGRSLLAHPIN